MRKFIEFVLFLILNTILGFIICIVLFHTALFANVKVLMYRGILLIVVTGIILAVFYYVINKITKGKGCLSRFEAKDIFAAIIVFMCIKLMFFTLVPVTVERSVSVFTLSKIAFMENQTISKPEMEEIFIDEYVDKNDAFGKRIDEQLVTGSIKKNADDTYTLTNRGNFLVNFFRFIGKLYNADMKNME